MKALPYITSACLCFVSTQGAFAQENLRRVPLIHQALDLDANGELSTAELEKAPASLITLDRDKDGALSSSEMRPTGRDTGRGRGNRPSGRDGRRGGGSSPMDIDVSPLVLGDPGIAWYGRLDTALAEAKASQRPILFMAAASQCSGVPGVF